MLNILKERLQSQFAGPALRFRELIGAKKPGSLQKETMPFTGVHASLGRLPEFAATITNVDIDLDYCCNGFHIDIIDFSNRNIVRYRIATPYLSDVVRWTDREIPKRSRPALMRDDRNVFPDDVGVPHTAHLTRDGRYLCASTKFCMYVIDTTCDALHLVPAEPEARPMQYCSSLGFSNDERYLYFTRWPEDEYMRFRMGGADRVHHEVGRVRLSDRHVESLYRIEFPPEGHQIACTPDGRHLILAPFNQKYAQYVTRSDMTAAEEIATYKARALETFSRIAVIDLERGSHRETAMPAPITAHFEFDPDDPTVIYAATHNFFLHPKYGPFLGGTSSITRLKIVEGATHVLKHYSHDHFFRLTQHRILKHKGKKYIVYTATAYSFYLIDVETNEVWRRVRVHPDPPLEPGRDFYIQTLAFPLNIEISENQRYIIISSRDAFMIYDVEDDNLLDIILTLPKGRSAYCHTRSIGH